LTVRQILEIIFVVGLRVFLARQRSKGEGPRAGTRGVPPLSLVVRSGLKWLLDPELIHIDSMKSFSYFSSAEMANLTTGSSTVAVLVYAAIALCIISDNVYAQQVRLCAF
jgi:hypothetical protein